MSISLFVWLWPTLAGLLLLLVMSQYNQAWAHRRILSEAVIGLQLAALPFLLTVATPWAVQLLLALLQAWAILLAARLLFGRLSIEFLRRSTHLNSIMALGAVVIVFDVWLVGQVLGLQAWPYRQVLVVLLLFSGVAGLGFLYQVIWTLKHYKLRNLDQNLGLRDLPTVTLAIPARNETHALEGCLRAAVASEYPKLEIIVLDDCSQDKTSEIIRSFAHNEVRFVQGDVPASGWLGKNQAFRTLAEHASGDFIFFADVDTYVAPQSITKLIKYALSNKLEMVTVLPERRDGWSLATILPHLRYYWQVALPVTARRLPVASQCWLIRRKKLTELGGFDAVRHKIVPETYFARRLFATEQYRFIISNTEVGVTTAKKWTSQIESGVRFLYPTFKRQPFLILLGSLLLCTLMLLPFVVALLSLHDARLWALALGACGMYGISYGLVVGRTHPLTWPVTLLCFPLSLLQELALLIGSMITYEFGDVNWKGRNVCYPVMRPSDRE